MRIKALAVLFACLPLCAAVNFDGYNPESETGEAKFHIVPDGVIEGLGDTHSITNIPPLEYNKSVDWKELEISGATFFRDVKYAVPTHEHLGDFIDWWRGFMATEDVEFLKEAFDCDNFANLFKTMYVLSSLKAETKTEAQVLVGTMIVKQEKEFAFVYAGEPSRPLWHMLNIVGTEKGWFVVEPQNGFFTSFDTYPNKETIVSIYF